MSRGLFERAVHVLKIDPLPYVVNELRSQGIIKEAKSKSGHVHVSESPLHLTPLITRFTEYMEVRSVTLAPATIKSYKTTLGYLKRFQHVQRATFLPDNVDHRWVDAFRSFLHRHDIVDDYVRKILKDLKTFMNWCDKRGYLTNKEFHDAIVLGNENEGLHVALTLDELDTWDDLDLSEYPGVERARCLFFIASYTGLRLSDTYRFDQSLIDGEFARIQPQKTGSAVICIPTHERLLRALQMRDELGSVYMSSQTYNVHLKTLGRLSGMTQMERVVAFKGNRREERLVPRWSRISSHTARRTFITIMLRQRVAPHLIMKITGHKSIKSFQRYIHLVEADSLDAVRSVFDQLQPTGYEEKAPRRHHARIQRDSSQDTLRLDAPSCATKTRTDMIQ